MLYETSWRGLWRFAFIFWLLFLPSAPLLSSPIHTFSREDLGPAIAVNSVFVAVEMIRENKLTFVGVVRSTAGARLFVFDPEVGRVTYTVRLGSSQGSWAIEKDQRYVYIGTYEPAELYRFDSDNVSLEKIANIPNSSYVMDIRLADDEIYIGTFPNSNLFSLNIDNFKLEDYGSLSKENYIRSLEPLDGKIYAGIGAKAGLIEFDPRTRQKRDILPEEFRGDSFVYWVRKVGKRLLLGMEPSNKIIALDLVSGSADEMLGDAVTAEPLVPIPNGGRLFKGYFDFLYHLSPDGQHLNRVLTTGLTHFIAAGRRGDIISGFTRDGIYLEYGLDGAPKRSVRLSDVGLEPEPAVPFSIAVANGTVFVAERDLRVYTPSSGVDTLYPIFGEAKAICIERNNVYTANYNGAVIWRYPFSELALGEKIDLTSPKYLFWDIGDQQNRPNGMLCDKDHLFVTTQPDYGLYGGALSIESPQGKRRVIRNMVRYHTIYSVDRSDENIFIGTGAFGGTGAHPIEGSAHIMKYDLDNKKVVFDVEPIPNNLVYFSLVALEGVLLGVSARGGLVKIDSETGELISENRSAGIRKMIKTISGDLYAITRREALGESRNYFVEIDPSTLDVREIDELKEPTHIAEDSLVGDIYVVANLRLFVYESK